MASSPAIRTVIQGLQRPSWAYPAACVALVTAILGVAPETKHALAKPPVGNRLTVADFARTRPGMTAYVVETSSWNDRPRETHRGQYKVLGPVPLAGRQVWRYDVEWDGGRSGKRYWREFQEVTADISRTVASQSVEWTPTPLPKPWVDLHGPIAKGTTWRFSNSSGDPQTGDFRVESRIVATDIAIDGWHQCIQVRSTDRSAGPADFACDGEVRRYTSMTNTTDIWYCPTVGQVRGHYANVYKLQGGGVCTRIADIWLDHVENGPDTQAPRK